MSKFTPPTVIILGFPLVAVVNVTVAMTFVSAAKLLDNTMEGAVSVEAKIGENATKFAPSMCGSLGRKPKMRCACVA